MTKILVPFLFLAADPSPSLEEAEAALRNAAAFFHDEVATEGGYLWRYSHDLSLREGEGTARPTQIWVQPPGTPAIGEAYLAAFRATKDQRFLEYAVHAARALVHGQLRSGGWDYRVEFEPERRGRYQYRVDPPREDVRNTTTLDDDTTQAALRLLTRVDKALNFHDQEVHDAARYGLEQVLKAQYPNGAWPQRYSRFPNPGDYPVLPARYPETWPRTHPDKDYRGYYTFNDNTLADLIDTYFLAATVYAEPKYRAAALKAADFILLAQMPAPQPGWAQQYNFDMHPAWARRFEPPAITGSESRGVLMTLIQVYERTGNEKYLEPIPTALAYYRASRLPNGQLARFYELETNRPLYFTTDYELTYNDDDLPTHYAFKRGDWTGSVQRAYDRANARDNTPESTAEPPRVTGNLAQAARDAITALDDRGAWVESGALRYHEVSDVSYIIDCRTFIRNVETLSRYIAASRAQSM